MSLPFLLIDQARWRADAPLRRDDATDATAAAAAGDDASIAHAPDALDDFIARAWRLPTLARTFAQHHLDPAAPGNAPAARALRALQGKFIVVNHPNCVPLPAALRPDLRTAVRRLVREAGAAASAADVVVTLHEPTRPLVAQEQQQLPSSGGGPEVRFAGEIVYRLTVRLEPADTTATGAAAAEAPATTPRELAPVFWFQLPLLVPDTEALAQMTAPTEHLYREITGRLGDATADRYWQVPAWERFRDQGRVIGCVMPSLVEHGYTPGVGRTTPAPAPPTAEDFLFGAPPTTSLFSDFTPDFDRRGFVPPGYCLVRYYCWVQVVVE